METLFTGLRPEIIDEILYGSQQIIQVVFHDIQNHITVNVKIAMRNMVTNTDYVLSRYFGTFT